jgi:hypothetical protein
VCLSRKKVHDKRERTKRVAKIEITDAVKVRAAEF